MTRCAEALRIDRGFVASAIAWGLASLFAFGVASAIVPNPVFGRQIPPEPFAIAVWVTSAGLVGILGATWSSPASPSRTTGARPFGPPAEGAVTGPGSMIGTVGAVGAFLAIGCPVCNKIALILLGTSGALTIFAPLQPVIGAASLALLAGTVAWRLRMRSLDGACPV